MEEQRPLNVENDGELILMQALMKAKQSADLAQKEKSELAARLSREIKGPLNAILGFTEILRQSIPDPTLQHYLNNIRVSGNSVLSTVDAILKPATSSAPAPGLDAGLSGAMMSEGEETSLSLMLKDALSEKEQLLADTVKGCVKLLIDILAMTNPEAFAQTLRVRSLAKKMAGRLALPNAWEIEVGVLLSHLGCAAIPTELVAKRQNGEKLTSQESALFNAHPKTAARFLSNIPGLAQVAKSIQEQFADFDPEAEADIIRDFIRTVFDYDNLIQAGSTQLQALDEMNAWSERYNPLVLGALEAEVRGLMEGHVVRVIPFEDLKSGMILAEDIHSSTNSILVRRNSELSDALLEKVRSSRLSNRTPGPVKVLQPMI